ncbi:hypothetical protein C8R44DRAFT_785497 [Mycena epipterygia]|nr:hypothetical protein C8R44DRAFT_785497 [Mycena epipterygia]
MWLSNSQCNHITASELEGWQDSQVLQHPITFAPSRYPFPCVLCGYKPSIHPSQATTIHEVLKDDRSGQYTDLFPTLGILNDVHFRIITGLDKEVRERFFWNYVPRKLSQFGFIELMGMIQDFVDANRWAPLSLVSIPRKSGLEAFLGKPNTCPKLVARVMHLSEEEYEQLSAEISQRIPGSLARDGSLDEKDPHAQALVEQIRTDYRMLDRYEDAWPIWVILKRIWTTQGTVRPPNVMLSPDCSFRESQVSPPMARHVHKCPRLSRYLASALAGREYVSPAAKSMLSVLHMDEELAPALNVLGVYDDARFETVKRMKPERKRQLLEAEDLELTAFQTLVMQMLFEN